MKEKRRFIMKRVLILGALVCLIIFGSSLIAGAGSAKKDRAVMKFDEPVSLLGVTLKGEYLFIHDAAAMARGDACTFVYKGVAEIPDKLVVSFHCIPEARSKVASFTARTESLSGVTVLREIQFAGSLETHLVPASK
jgi:hypothetical protein